MKSETIVLNEERNVSLDACIQPMGGGLKFEKRPAVVVIPGGAYNHLSEREADPIALFYAANGYQTFILRYTLTNKGGWPYPLKDYDAAMDVILKRSEEWHIDTKRIAIIGFSAGGHLAACAMTMGKFRPSAAILVYPALLKPIVDLCQEGMPYPLEYIREDNCPCFIVSARNDNTVEVENTLKLMETLHEKGISFESHVYAFGGHGFGGAYEFTNNYKVSKRDHDWMDESLEWLDEMLGKLTAGGFEESDVERG
ncbi:MAG: alpha/beta hydrolase [Erysipelotrichaceae bacterium]|nr:alpha/beta hydrolase [Erysipelotrichaceae bacterium]